MRLGISPHLLAARALPEAGRRQDQGAPGLPVAPGRVRQDWQGAFLGRFQRLGGPWRGFRDESGQSHLKQTPPGCRGLGGAEGQTRCDLHSGQQSTSGQWLGRRSILGGLALVGCNL